MKAIYGRVELENGLVIDWLRFATSGGQALLEVIAQHVHVVSCWVTKETMINGVSVCYI